MPPILGITLAADQTTVLIERGSDVPDDAWLQIRATWNADGRNANRRVEVSLERFMGQRGAFIERCRSLGLGAAPDAGIVELVRLQQS